MIPRRPVRCAIRFRAAKTLFLATMAFVSGTNSSCSKSNQPDQSSGTKPEIEHHPDIFELKLGDRIEAAKSAAQYDFRQQLLFAHGQDNYQVYKTYADHPKKGGIVLLMVFKNDRMLSVIMPKPPYVTEEDADYRFYSPGFWGPEIDVNEFVAVGPLGMSEELADYFKQGQGLKSATRSEPNVDYGLAVGGAAVVAIDAIHPIGKARQEKWEAAKAKFDARRISLGLSRATVDSRLESPLFVDQDSADRQICYYAPREYSKNMSILDLLIVVEFVNDVVVVVRSDMFAFSERFRARLFSP